jgi:hypothetical protein
MRDLQVRQAFPAFVTADQGGCSHPSFSLELAPREAIMAQEETMRRVLSVTLLILIGIGLSVASAQVTDPANSRIHSVIGIVTQVSASSISLRADNGERELKIDKSTSVSSPRKGTLTNDLVYRERKNQPRLADFVKVGDEALVTYRDDDGVLTALKITDPPPGKKTGR